MDDTPPPRRVQFDNDLDGWTIDLDRPGPAGTATVEISPRLRLLVDVAEPHRIGAILTTEEPGDSLDAVDTSTVAAIFGHAVLQELPGGRSRARSQRTADSPGEVAEVRDHLARLAIADDVTIGATDAIVGAVAGAEAALLAELLRHDSDITIGHPTATTVAAQRLISAYADVAERTAPGADDRLAGLLLGLAAFTSPSLAAQLRAPSEDQVPRNTAAEIGSWHPHQAPVGYLDFDESDGSIATGHLRLDRRLFSSALLDPSARAQVAWHRSDGDLAVRCRVTDGAYLVALGTQWVRAYRPATRTVLALAPLEPLQPTGDGQWAEARLHIGGQDATALLVDVTDAPGQQPPSVVRRSVQEAIGIGCNAAHFERAGSAAAVEAWEACAQTWRSTGDTDREALALSRAANLASAARQPDRTAALHARRSDLQVTWAASRLDPHPPVAPLVADLLVSGNADSQR